MLATRDKSQDNLWQPVVVPQDELEHFDQDAVNRILWKSQREPEAQGVFYDNICAMPDLDREEFLCYADERYFIEKFVKIYDNDRKEWIPFHFWESQVDIFNTISSHKYVVVLKARQMGFSWYALARALHQCQYRPISAILVFSKRDQEVKYLLGLERFKGMFLELPEHIVQADLDPDNDNAHLRRFQNGSYMQGSTGGGRGYSATMAIVDEADYIDDLSSLISACKPAIKAEGMTLISTSDKLKPNTDYKRIFRSATRNREQEMGGGITIRWEPIFLNWRGHPDRDNEWYEQEKAEWLSEHGSLDRFYAEYPETIEQALAPAEANKRIPGQLLAKVVHKQEPLPFDDLENLPIEVHELQVFEAPTPYGEYYMGSDCAQGLPQSNNSATIVVNERGHEVCNLVGKFDPTTHAQMMMMLSGWYNDAMVLIEENFHGFAAIEWFKNNGYSGVLGWGYNNRPGWVSNQLGKNELYRNLYDMVRSNDMIIRDPLCYFEIQSIEFESLRAPQGDEDDRADAFALAMMQRYQHLRMSDVTVMSLD